MRNCPAPKRRPRIPSPFVQLDQQSSRAHLTTLSGPLTLFVRSSRVKRKEGRTVHTFQRTEKVLSVHFFFFFHFGGEWAGGGGEYVPPLLHHSTIEIAPTPPFALLREGGERKPRFKHGSCLSCLCPRQQR